MPIAKANPANEITFIDRPSPAIATKVPITETGIATKTMMVGTTCRKNNIKTVNAMIPPTQIFCFTRLIAEEI